MTIRILSAEDIDEALSPEAAVDAMRSAFAQLSSGDAVVPIRGRVESARGVTLLMPAFLGASDELGAKVVSVFPGAPDRGEPAIQGAVLLLDASTGRAKALLDGTRLTAIRTAAGSALATELLASPVADVLAVFGAGVQARSHIELISRTRRLAEIRIVSRSGVSAAALADSLRSGSATLLPAGDTGPCPRVLSLEDPKTALAGAGVIVTATTSTEPVFDGGDLEPGAHVNAVGSHRPDMQEVDARTILRARVVVDQREAAWEEAGDLIVPLRDGVIGENVISAELGDIVRGVAPPGSSGHEITLFKSVGNAAQDVAIGGAALRLAERAGLGREVPF